MFVVPSGVHDVAPSQATQLRSSVTEHAAAGENESSGEFTSHHGTRVQVRLGPALLTVHSYCKIKVIHNFSSV